MIIKQIYPRLVLNLSPLTIWSYSHSKLGFSWKQFFLLQISLFCLSTSSEKTKGGWEAREEGWNKEGNTTTTRCADRLFSAQKEQMNSHEREVAKALKS